MITLVYIFDFSLYLIISSNSLRTNPVRGLKRRIFPKIHTTRHNAPKSFNMSHKFMMFSLLRPNLLVNANGRGESESSENAPKSNKEI